MQRKICATDYNELEFQVSQVRDIISLVLEHLYQAPDVCTATGREGAVAYLSDMSTYCAILSGAASITRDVIDEIAATLEGVEA